MIDTLDRFFNTGENAFDVNKLTLGDFLRIFRQVNFEEYFDRGKILAYLKRKVQDFEEKILGKEFCPYCNSLNVKEISDYCGGVKKYFRCLDCEGKFKHRGLVGTHFEDWVYVNCLAGISQGKTIREIYRSLVNEMENRRLDYNSQTKIPSEKTLYGIVEKCAEKLQKFNDFMIFLIGGVDCSMLFVDDAFAHKQKKKKKQKALVKDENVREEKRKGKREKWERFFYAIVSFDPHRQFLINVHIASSRNKKAFEVAFASTRLKIKGLPQVIRGDKLSSMVRAAEKCFPRSLVKHVFERLKRYEKEELNKIERRIRDLRKTIKKRRKYGSLRMLRDIATIGLISETYLEPKGVLGGKTAAQATGIPYAFRKFDWRFFSEWVNWVYTHIPKILKAGLKQIPGTQIEPVTDEKEEAARRTPKATGENAASHVFPSHPISVQLPLSLYSDAQKEETTRTNRISQSST